LLFFFALFAVSRRLGSSVVGYVVDTHRLSLGVGVDCLGRFPAVIVSPSSCPVTTKASQKSFPKINARVVRIGADGGDGHSLRVELGQLIVVAFVPIEPADRLTDTGGGPTAEILTQIFGFPPHMLSLHHPLCCKEHKDSYSYLVLFFSFLSYLSVVRS
jgi:hypothetical protein